jgi:hypothetical protein
VYPDYSYEKWMMNRFGERKKDKVSNTSGWINILDLKISKEILDQLNIYSLG